MLESFSQSVNEALHLPRDILVTAKECDEANAYYDPNTHTITICYELAVAERELLDETGVPPEAIEHTLQQSAVGTLYHELGHMLIDQLQLPITGKEEDVADQLAAYVLASNEDGSESLVAIADLYALAADNVVALEDLAFSDVHSLDAQRAANFLCYAYGSAPEAYRYLIEDGRLDEDRAKNCELEYQQMIDGWDALLQPHLKITS